MNERQLFQKYLAPTSPEPMALHITKASGSYLYDDTGKAYIDLIGGISVCNVGHRHPKVIAAIREQAEQYLHVMVYGEVVQTPMVQYAALLAKHLPEPLSSVYFTNSVSEGGDKAKKLAKRAPRRSQIVACNKSYHDTYQVDWGQVGAVDLCSKYRAWRSMIPRVEYTRSVSLAHIDLETA